MPSTPHGNPEIPAAVLALISEMQAKILNPDADQLTITLATMTLEGIMPMLDGYTKRRPNAA